MKLYSKKKGEATSRDIRHINVEGYEPKICTAVKAQDICFPRLWNFIVAVADLQDSHLNWIFMSLYI